MMENNIPVLAVSNSAVIKIQKNTRCFNVLTLSRNMSLIKKSNAKEIATECNSLPIDDNPTALL